MTGAGSSRWPRDLMRAAITECVGATARRLGLTRIEAYDLARSVLDEMPDDPRRGVGDSVR
jgi:hypothetical protein